MERTIFDGPGGKTPGITNAPRQKNVARIVSIFMTALKYFLEDKKVRWKKMSVAKDIAASGYNTYNVRKMI